MNTVAIDTGPIVALLNARDRHHVWAKATFARLTPPLLTCESVLTEACHLVRSARGGSSAVLALVTSGMLEVHFDLASEVRSVTKLLDRYASVPMSLADASLVRMAELDARLQIVTLDSDFHVYRRNGRQALKLLTPPMGN